MHPWVPVGFDAASWTRSPGDRGRGRHVDRLLATLADLQHGAVGCAQLLAVGVTHSQIEERIKSGHLHRVFIGVYAVGRRTLTPHGRRMAVFLAGGDGARLSGWSGATQRVLLPEAGTRVDLAIPVSRRVQLPGVNVTRLRPIASEVTLADGIPTHTVPRLLLDLASRKDDPDLLEWAWRQAVFTRTLDVAGVQRVLGDHDGEPGTPALRALCDRRAELAGTLHNRFELLMLSIIREAGLPEPLCSVPYEVAPGVVLRPDFRIPSLKLVLEGDGRDGHGDVEFLLTDDQRDAYYRGKGNTVMRYSWWEAKRERGRVVGLLQDHKARNRRR